VEACTRGMGTEKCRDRKVPPERRHMLMTLTEEFPLLEKVHGRVKNAFYCGLLAVPKTNNLWWVIFDTRELNGFVCPPTQFQMATVEDVFITILLNTYFAVFDIRHEFFQIAFRRSPKISFYLTVMERSSEVECGRWAFHTVPSSQPVCALPYWFWQSGGRVFSLTNQILKVQLQPR